MKKIVRHNYDIIVGLSLMVGVVLSTLADDPLLYPHKTTFVALLSACGFVSLAAYFINHRR